MRRLIYTSQSAVGVDAGVLANILAVAQANNARDGITGMLWFGDGTFAQVLEGEDAVIGETIGRIGRDPRHTALRMIEDRVVAGRIFGDWGMLQADNGPVSIANTAYLVGLCARSETGEARRLFDFLIDYSG